MIRNMLTITARALWRERGYTALNLIGLTIGFACCILIARYVQAELSYDTFHEDAQQIVYVGSEQEGGERGRATPYPLADALQSDLPSVQEAVRVLWPGSGDVRADEQDAFAEEEGVFHAEASFFEVFSFPMVRGNPRTALQEPNTAVVTPAFAAKHFPGEDPIGKTFTARRYGEHEYRITGIAETRENSYLDFGALLSSSTLRYDDGGYDDAWGASMFVTFARLADEATPEQFEAQAASLARQHLGDDTETTFFAQPLPGLYLSELVSADGFRGEWRYVYLFSTVALIILLLACINYINLMTARATQRAREVGVRRTVGAGRGQVAAQFLAESVLLASAAFGLGLALAWSALPSFNALFGTDLGLGGGPTLVALAGAAVGVGLLAGSYPALVLSGFRPTEVLRGAGADASGGARLRNGLVVVQFAVAVALLICTGVVYQQLQYTQAKDLGFEGEQVVVAEVPRGQGDAFRERVLGHASVASASLAESVPGQFYLTMGAEAGQVAPGADVEDDTAIRFRPAVADTSYVETLGLEIIAGRDVDPQRASDQQEAHLLNETAAEALGWTPGDAAGQPFSLDGDPGRVVGVVRDFHTASLHEPIRPVVIQFQALESMSASPQLVVRLAGGSVAAGMEHLRAQWDGLSADPFSYAFLDERFAAMYEAERRLGRVFALFAGIAIAVACLGLFGLAAYAAERRRKEIAIRKVLGATAQSVVALLSTDFLRLVALALVVAAPVAYVLMQRWLEDFAYRIDLGPGVFVLAIAATLAVALATVSAQALRAAWMDPAPTLRSE